eukprot:365283-Chlamydomonas_euryale.AAC.1
MQDLCTHSSTQQRSLHDCCASPPRRLLHLTPANVSAARSMQLTTQAEVGRGRCYHAQTAGEFCCQRCV